MESKEKLKGKQRKTINKKPQNLYKVLGISNRGQQGILIKKETAQNAVCCKISTLQKLDLTKFFASQDIKIIKELIQKFEITS